MKGFQIFFSMQIQGSLAERFYLRGQERFRGLGLSGSRLEASRDLGFRGLGGVRVHVANPTSLEPLEAQSRKPSSRKSLKPLETLHPKPSNPGRGWGAAREGGLGQGWGERST